MTFPFLGALGLAGLWTAVGGMRRRGSGFSCTWLASVALTASDGAVALTAVGVVLKSRGGDGNDLWGWLLAGGVVAFWAWVRTWLVVGGFALAERIRRGGPGNWSELRSGWSPALLLFGGAGTVMTMVFVWLADAACRVVGYVSWFVGDLVAMALLAVFFLSYVRGLMVCFDAAAGERAGAAEVNPGAAGAEDGGAAP